MEIFSEPKAYTKYMFSRHFPYKYRRFQIAIAIWSPMLWDENDRKRTFYRFRMKIEENFENKLLLDNSIS